MWKLVVFLYTVAILTTSILADLTSSQEDGNTNNSNCSLGLNDWSFTFVPLYVMTIAVLGIFLNIFVLMVFILHKKPCSVAEIYLSNLAAADLVLVSFLPFWAYNAWNEFEWIFGLALCKMVNVGIQMNAYCSIYFLVLVSMDRYLALVHPMSHEKIRRPKFAKMFCVMVWILGFFLSIPKLINRELIENSTGELTNPTNLTHCGEPNETITFINECMILVLGFFIPIPFILFGTVKILQALKTRFVENVNRKQKDQKATSLVLAVLVAFLICWLPYHLLKIPSWLHDARILTGCRAKWAMYFCGQIFTYMAFFNSVLNPILYVIVGNNFRKKGKELFLQWILKRTSTISRTRASTRKTKS